MSLPSLSSSPTQCVLSLGHSSDSGWPKISLGGQTNDNHLVQGWDCLADARKFPTWTVNVLTLYLVMHTSPSFVALHHRLQQSASELIFSVFKNHIADCILQVLAFFIFMFILNDYSKWGKKLWHCTAQYTCSFDTQKVTDLHRKGTCHLHDCCLWSFLIFWMHLVLNVYHCGELRSQKCGMSPLPVNLLQNMSVGKSRRIRWVQGLIFCMLCTGDVTSLLTFWHRSFTFKF